MPMHDWERVGVGAFHNFHTLWLAGLANRLNAGLLPEGYFAMVEGPDHAVPIVVPLPAENERYAAMARRVAIHHGLGVVVVVIELVSPGNKDRAHAFKTFVAKAVDLLRQGVNLLTIDPFPPGRHDPRGLPAAIVDEFVDQAVELPADKPLTLAAYQAEPRTVYIEPLAVGDALPDMPLFLQGERYLSLPLEETYQSTWQALPLELRKLVAS